MAPRMSIPAEELLEDVHRRLRRTVAPTGHLAADAAVAETVAPVGKLGAWLRDVAWRGLGPFPRFRSAVVRFDHRRRSRPPEPSSDPRGLADELVLQAARMRRLEEEIERGRGEIEDLKDVLSRLERRLATLEEEIGGGSRGAGAAEP